MKKILAFVLVLGCSSSPGEVIVVETKPDAGSETSSSSGSSSSSGASCIPIVWSYGPDRFCEECVCPGTECKMSPLGSESVTVGECGDDLKCSTPCTDPLWIEKFGQ